MIRTVLTAIAMSTVATSAIAADAPKTPRDAAVAILGHGKLIYQRVCEASPAPGATVLPAAVEVRLGRALVIASDILTKGDDKELMTGVVDFVAVSGCSSNRAPGLTLARIFRARPDALQAAIEAVPAGQRCSVISQLDWGWKNDFLPTPTAAGVGTDREARIKKLKAAGKCS